MIVPEGTPPMAARVIRSIAALICVTLFLLPIAGMIQHQLAVREAERLWRETVKHENEKTDRAVESFMQAVKRAKEGRR